MHPFALALGAVLLIGLGFAAGQMLPLRRLQVRLPWVRKGPRPAPSYSAVEDLTEQIIVAGQEALSMLQEARNEALGALSRHQEAVLRDIELRSRAASPAAGAPAAPPAVAAGAAPAASKPAPPMPEPPVTPEADSTEPRPMVWRRLEDTQPAEAAKQPAETNGNGDTAPTSLRQKVFDLAGQGRSATEIARALGLTRGEVELMLSLRHLH